MVIIHLIMVLHDNHLCTTDEWLIAIDEFLFKKSLKTQHGRFRVV